ncbi:MAG: metal-sulfur cluster assembly factor, partial [Actinobacteria bacterium]
MRARGVGAADRRLASRGGRVRVLQQRLGRFCDQERVVVEAALGRLARLVGVEPSRDEILQALEQVIDPELRRPVTELDMVRDVRIDGGDVAVTIALTVAGCPLRSSFEQQVAEALAPVAGVERVSLDFDVMSPEEKAALTTKLRG